MPELAAALSFDPELDRAPIVKARGRGDFARQVVHVARENGIPVLENAYLANLLVDLPAGKEIPENLYRSVAAVLAMVYDLERSALKK